MSPTEFFQTCLRVTFTWQTISIDYHRPITPPIGLREGDNTECAGVDNVLVADIVISRGEVVHRVRADTAKDHKTLVEQDLPQGTGNGRLGVVCPITVHA